MTMIDEGAYEATAEICNVEKHVWAGWRLDNLMEDKRWSYFTVYFSQGGEWTNIADSCIQADRIPDINIDGNGKESVEIECVKKEECPMGPQVTIHLPDKGLCSIFWDGDLKCRESTVDAISTYSTTLKKPVDERFSFVTCSTTDSFQTYVVDWGL